MYSVATLTFGQVTRLTFMGPLSRFMLWVAVAAWVAVAGASVVRLFAGPSVTESGRFTEDGHHPPAR
jgi:hypothetical protein